MFRIRGLAFSVGLNGSYQVAGIFIELVQFEVEPCPVKTGIGCVGAFGILLFNGSKVRMQSTQ